MAQAERNVRETVDALYRSESRRVLATLIRLLGDFDLAEEVLHDAFRAAVEQTCLRRPSGWGACWSNCCPKLKRWVCWL